MPQGKQWRNELLQLVDLYYPGVDTTNFTGFLTLLERWHVHGEAGMLFHTRAPHTLTPMRTIELADTLGGARLHTQYLYFVKSVFWFWSCSFFGFGHWGMLVVVDWLLV